MPERKATPAVAVEFTSTSERRGTRRRAFGTPNIMASHESLIAEALKLDRGRMNRYCRTVDPRFLEQVNRRKPRTMSAAADIWYNSNGASYGRNHHYNDSRYHMLNLHATFTKGTVEFRLFQFNEPTAELQGRHPRGQLKSYIQLCLALSQMAKDVRTASPKPHRTRTPNRHAHLAPPPGLHRRGVRNGQRFSDPQSFWGHSLPAR